LRQHANGLEPISTYSHIKKNLIMLYTYMERSSEDYLLVTKYSTCIYSTGKGKSTRDETQTSTPMPSLLLNKMEQTEAFQPEVFITAYSCPISNNGVLG
jgi:hypothetical protein